MNRYSLLRRGAARADHIRSQTETTPGPGGFRARYVRPGDGEAGYRMLTRDVRRYRTYFPTIEIIAPALAEDETAG